MMNLLQPLHLQDPEHCPNVDNSFDEQAVDLDHIVETLISSLVSLTSEIGCHHLPQVQV